MGKKKKKKEGLPDSPHWTDEQELDSVAISFIFSVAPCRSGYVHANTALQRCLITASWVPEMQMEGRPWSCRVVHGESLLRERGDFLPSKHPVLEEEM